MTPQQFRTARLALGLSAEKMAIALGVSGGRTVRKWERGDNKIPGPVEFAMRFLVREKR